MGKYKKGKITIYTPTYNRAYCLHQLYESLCRQTQSYDDFEWLVVDDGSIDNTEELVQGWMQESSFKITYYKQKNEGKMAKLNFIHQIIDTELCMCMDSDDYLLDDAIENIYTLWSKIRDRKNVAGIVGLDIYKNGNIVGTGFPKGIEVIKYRDFSKFNIKGDKKFVYRTEVVSAQPPYPSINNEKFPAPGYLYRLIDVNYDLSVLNKPLCVVEYLEDGLSKNKYIQFVRSPNAFMFYRQERIRLATSFSEKFRNAIHYVSSCIFAKQSVFSEKNKAPFITFIAVPFGVVLNIYLRATNKKGVV